MSDKTPKILLIDIETAPKVAYVWRFFKENIGAKQGREHGHIMSFAAKWLGDDTVFYMENRKSNDKAIVKKLCEYLDKADILVAHNGVGFDFPQIKGRALTHGLKPPSPFKTVDTCRVARKEFGFPSNSLEYLTTVLKCSNQKTSHKKFPGFTLWLECLRNNEEAWLELKEYNIQDVLALEELYLKVRPWVTNHPNVSSIMEKGHSCPKCGSSNLKKRGFAHSSVGKYQRYQCGDCGGWARSSITEKKERVLVNQTS